MRHELGFYTLFDGNAVQEQEFMPFIGQRVALDLNPWDVFRLTRLALERHVRIVRGAVVFAVIAAHAGADKISQVEGPPLLFGTM